MGKHWIPTEMIAILKGELFMVLDLIAVRDQLEYLILPVPTCVTGRERIEETMRELDWEKFSSRIRSRRRELKLLQGDIKSSGMNPVYLRHWEVGNKKPGVLENFYKVCIVLETDPRYLMGMIDTPNSGMSARAQGVTKEASAIIDIMDKLPERHRSRMLTFATMEEDLAQECEKLVADKNSRILELLGTAITEVGGKTMMPPAGAKGNRSADNEPTEPIVVNFNWAKFSERLIERREAMGYTQEDMETNTGMSRPYYANWETGRKTPNLLVNFAIVCAYLRTDPRYFLGMTDSPDPSQPTYAPNSYDETRSVALIVDRLPSQNRHRVLRLAQMEVETAEECNNLVVEKNRKIIALLNSLIHEVGESSGGTPTTQSVVDLLFEINGAKVA